MMLLKLRGTRQLRLLFLLVLFTSILFLYYASSSIDVKSTVHKVYQHISYIKNNQFDFEAAFSNGTLFEFTNYEYVNSTNQQFTSSLVKNGSTFDLTERTSYVDASTSIVNSISRHLASANSSNVNNNFTSCPIIPPNLGTRISINKTAFSIDQIEHFPLIEQLGIELGGLNKPKTCQANYRVAIVVPYRDRLENLELFLAHMHPFLSKQQLEYAIYIIEPVEKITFNRGLLMNIGYNEAIKDSKWDCFVFHDVDLLPEDERNIYSCPETPRHMSSAVSTLKYKIPYDAIFGGVTSFLTEHFEKINGFSNMFFGWGAEDDDLRNRVIRSGLKVSRYPLEIGRYYMAKHKKDKPNPKRFDLLNKGKARFKKDGITSLDYELLSVEKKKLYTRVLVKYDEAKIVKQKK